MPNTDFVNNLADALHRSQPDSEAGRMERGQWRVDCQAIADALRAVVPGPRLGTTGAGFDRDEFLDRCYGRGQTTDEPPVDVEDTPPGR